MKKNSSLKPYGLFYYTRFFYQNFGIKTYYLFCLTLFSTLAEGVGILMLVPLFETLSPVPGHGKSINQSNWVMNLYSNLIAEFDVSPSSEIVILVMVLAFSLKGVMVFFSQSYGEYLFGQFSRKLRTDLIRQFGSMTYANYSRYDTGHFINLIDKQVAKSLGCLNAILLLIAQLVNSSVYVIFIILLSWRFGLAALVTGIILMTFFYSINFRVRNISRKLANEGRAFNKSLIQLMHAFKYLKAVGQFDAMGKRVIGSIDRIASFEIKTGIALSFVTAVKEPITVVAIAFILWLQIFIFNEPIAAILVAILFFYRGLNSVLLIQKFWVKVLQAVGSVDLVERSLSNLQSNQEFSGSIKIKEIKNTISFREVTFAYEANKDNVIKNVTFEIKPRTSVAIVGESGGGKSTILDILTLMLRPQKGDILLDGVPGYQIELSSWRAQFGYVSQDMMIFDDTIAKNIAVFEGDAKNDEELIALIKSAAKQAHLSDYIESLPDGYHTMVGERGLKLSGGQKQRLFIARELFRKPKILLLDEATSSLDSESERAIQESIDELKGKTTVIIVAHRLSTIRNADRIFVLSDGRIVEQGTFKELSELNHSKFKQMLVLQES